MISDRVAFLIVVLVIALLGAGWYGSLLEMRREVEGLKSRFDGYGQDDLVQPE